MDDYYEFKHDMNFKLRSGTYIGGLLPCVYYQNTYTHLRCDSLVFSSSAINGSVSGSGTIRSGGIDFFH
jgi:hypothetical protein